MNRRRTTSEGLTTVKKPRGEQAKLRMIFRNNREPGMKPEDLPVSQQHYGVVPIVATGGMEGQRQFSERDYVPPTAN
jgi:hypothetical protein